MTGNSVPWWEYKGYTLRDPTIERRDPEQYEALEEKLLEVRHLHDDLRQHLSDKTAAERKSYPLATGVLDYFPDALLAVSEVSRAGNEQHHPGTPLHWDKSKSTDEADALMRHFLDRGKLDGDGIRHTAKIAWRALAMLQREIENERQGA